MSEVKSLNITADTYRHRGWMWRDRATYEIFKAYMKLPLWIDRILTDNAGENVYIVGKEDGLHNTAYAGNLRTGVRNITKRFEKHRARYTCRVHPHNGFVVIAERIRAKKPDANKTPRPQWRRTMTKPWEPGTLGGNWVVDSKFVKEVKLNVVPPPAWADRLFVSTSANRDTFVWVNSDVKRTGQLGEVHDAQHAKGIQGFHAQDGNFVPDEVFCSPSCHWQLAGVRKKTVRVFRSILNPPVSLLNLDFSAIEATAAFLYGDLEPKPPIGVKPRSVHDEERANALDEAMVRYLNEDLPFPIEWAVEWNELRARLNKEQK